MAGSVHTDGWQLQPWTFVSLERLQLVPARWKTETRSFSPCWMSCDEYPAKQEPNRPFSRSPVLDVRQLSFPGNLASFMSHEQKVLFICAEDYKAKFPG